MRNLFDWIAILLSGPLALYAVFAWTLAIGACSAKFTPPCPTGTVRVADTQECRALPVYQPYSYPSASGGPGPVIPHYPPVPEN